MVEKKDEKISLICLENAMYKHVLFSNGAKKSVELSMVSSFVCRMCTLIGWVIMRDEGSLIQAYACERVRVHVNGS